MTQALSPIKPLAVSAMTATTALGAGCQPLLAALRAGRSGLKPCDFETARLPTWIGEAPGIDGATLPAALAAYDCRNQRLAWLGLQADGFLPGICLLCVSWVKGKALLPEIYIPQELPGYFAGMLLLP